MITPEKLPHPKVKAPEKVPALKKENEKHPLLIRQRLIDAAEGRLIGVVEELDESFKILSKHEKTVTVFGSKRLPPDDAIAINTYELCRHLASKGYTIVTGGGHGVMEAANRGAYDAGGHSIGFNILLPEEQTLNEYTTENFQFEHFFGRKVSMTLDASAYIFLPGGFGTFDELFEILTLIQTKKIPKAPVILVGSAFWKPVDQLIKTVMLKQFKTIDAPDITLYEVMDDYDDIVRLIEAHIKAEKRRKKD